MNKILLTLLCSLMLLLSANSSFAETINFQEYAYHLKYSKKLPNGYLNEYVRDSQTLDNYTKLLGVFYFENEISPIDYVLRYAKHINSLERGTILNVIENKEKNSAIVSCALISSKPDKYYIEYNVFKYEKYNGKGIIGFQYVQKSTFKKDDKDSFVKTFNRIKNNDMKYINLVVNTPIPNIVKKETSE